MGVCYYNHYRKINNKLNDNSESRSDLDVLKKKYEDTNKNKNNNNNENTVPAYINENQYSNSPTTISENSPMSKNTMNPHNRSNISSNSHYFITPQPSQDFTIEATLGEVEIPVYVEKNDNIEIQINQDNNNDSHMWSFLQNENPINYLGYQNYKYKNYNLGALFVRIAGSNKIYHLDKKIYTFKANSKGSLLFWVNLDPNDYPIYEPKGSLSIKIIGGMPIDETELFEPYPYYQENNNYYDNLKEKIIIKYINYARNDLLEFFNDYFYVNDNPELKNYINKNNFKRKQVIYDKELNIIAKEHCEDLCNNGTCGDIGTNGLNYKDRIKKHNSNSFYNGECIIYGTNNPLLIVKNMIEDRYSKKKKNRYHLMFLHYTKVGICLREHISYKYCCVIVFSE